MTVNKSEVREGLPNGFPSPTSEGGRPVNGPAAGNGNGSSLNGTGNGGHYWSSSPDSNYPLSAQLLGFDQFSFVGYSSDRYYGYVVRPVR